MKKVSQEELNKFIDLHNAYEHDDQCTYPPVDFGGCIYDGLVFRNACLSQCTFSRSQLINCKFINCTLPRKWKWGNGFINAVLENCEFINCDAFNCLPIQGYFEKVTINKTIAVYDKNNVWVSCIGEDETYKCTMDLNIVDNNKYQIHSEWFLKVKNVICQYVRDNPAP